MKILKGTKADLEKLAARVDLVTRVSEIRQVNVGGGIHGTPPVLTRGVPTKDDKDNWVYIASDVDPKIVTDAAAAAKVTVAEEIAADVSAEVIKR